MDKNGSTKLFWLVLCFSLLTNTGYLGAIDVNYRLATAHWLWTGAPPVDETDTHPFLLKGKDGLRHSWYGLGQSLLMLPADVAGTLLVDRFRNVGAVQQNRRTVFEGVVAILTFPLLAALAACALYALLLRLRFAPAEAFLSVLAAVFATRLLNIMQIHQEDIHHLLFLAGAMACLVKWLDDGRGLSIGLAALAFGFNLLTRLTTAVDVVVVSAGVATLLLLEQKAAWRAQVPGRLKQVVLIFAPVLLLFLLADRVFHFVRFGEWTSTYLDLQRRALSGNPEWPVDWPWTYPFWEGFAQAFYSPFWGVIYFDPLFVVSIVLIAVGWRHLSLRFKVVGLTMAVLWLAYAAFYARYYLPPGFWSWGNRYLSVPTILLCALAFPAWLQLRHRLPRFVHVVLACVVLWSIAVQTSSIMFHVGSELTQSRVERSSVDFVDRVHAAPQLPIIIRRFENIGTMIREGVLASTFRPHFVAIRVALLKSGDAYIFPAYVRWGLLAAWGIALSLLVAVMLRSAWRAWTSMAVPPVSAACQP